MQRAFLIALFLMAPLALTHATEAAAPPPVPQMKPCVAIDEASVSSVIRIVNYVAKSDYRPGRLKKKTIFDRLPEAADVEGKNHGR